MYHNLLSILRKENYRNRIDIDLTVSIYKNGLINEIYSKKMKWWLTVWPYTVRMIMTIFWHYRYPVHSSSGENSPRMIEHSWLTNVTFTAMRTDDKTKSWFNKKKKKTWLIIGDFLCTSRIFCHKWNIWKGYGVNQLEIYTDYTSILAHLLSIIYTACR